MLAELNKYMIGKDREEHAKRMISNKCNMTFMEDNFRKLLPVKDFSP